MKQILLTAILLVSACVEAPARFENMSAEERRTDGSAAIRLACIGQGDVETRPSRRVEIAYRRALDYLSFVGTDVSQGDLQRYVVEEAWRPCLDGEGELRRRVTALVLRGGTDAHVEEFVLSVADPVPFCRLRLERHYEPVDAERIYAACRRLSLR